MTENFLENDSFNIPKNYKQKQKFNTLKLIFYIIIVIVIAVAAYIGYKEAAERYLPTVTFDKSRQPIVYQKLTDIVVKNIKSADFTVTPLQSETEDSLKIANKGSVFFFLSKNNETGLTDLCVRRLENDENTLSDIKVIDTNVSDFKATNNAKIVAYKKEGHLYISDTKKSRIMASDIADYYLNKSGSTVMFFNDNDKSIYICKTEKKSKPILVDTGIDKLITPKTEYENIYYIKDSILYKKEETKDPTAVAQDVIDAILLDDFLYYTTEEMYEKPFAEIFDDSFLTKDAKLKIPKMEDYIKKTDGVSMFDADGYQTAMTLYEEKQFRDKIRSEYKKSPAEVMVYSLYIYDRDTSKRVDIYLESPYLEYCDSSKDIILYKAYDTDVYKTEISTITNLDEINNAVHTSLGVKMDTDLKLLKKGRIPYMAFEEIVQQVVIPQDSEYMYCAELTPDATTDLVRYTITNKSLKSRTVIAKDISEFFVDKNDPATVTVFSGDAIGIYTDGKYTHLSDNSSREYFFVDGSFFYYDYYDESLKTGTLMVFRNGESSVIDSGVHEFDVRNYNTISYIKNYHADSDIGTLYVKSGRIKRKEDICVRTILN